MLLLCPTNHAVGIFKLRLGYNRKNTDNQIRMEQSLSLIDTMWHSVGVTLASRRRRSNFSSFSRSTIVLLHCANASSCSLVWLVSELSSVCCVSNRAVKTSDTDRSISCSHTCSRCVMSDCIYNTEHTRTAVGQDTCVR